jgi:hypothetical protein
MRMREQVLNSDQMARVASVVKIVKGAAEANVVRNAVGPRDRSRHIRFTVLDIDKGKCVDPMMVLYTRKDYSGVAAST